MSERERERQRQIESVCVCVFKRAKNQWKIINASVNKFWISHMRGCSSNPRPPTPHPLFLGIRQKCGSNINFRVKIPENKAHYGKRKRSKESISPKGGFLKISGRTPIVKKMMELNGIKLMIMDTIEDGGMKHLQICLSTTKRRTTTFRHASGFCLPIRYI